MSKNILDEIVANTRRDVEDRQTKVTLNFLKEQIVIGERDSSFVDAILNPTDADVAIIGEIKLAAPSVGELATEQEVVPTAVSYQGAGVDAISVITDHKYFKGDIEFIQRVKNHVSAPILQKDFVVDEYQIYEAVQAGSNAILLIARIVDAPTLQKFVGTCAELGIEPIVEIYDDLDVEKTAASGARVIAVNARNLTTFEVDIDNACGLLEQLDEDFIKLGFSGVSARSDVEKYSGAGARGVLVGTSLMKAVDIKSYISELKGI